MGRPKKHSGDSTDTACVAHNVAWNRTDHPIFIVTKFETDPKGGPGIPTQTFMVSPGQGIDLTIIGLTLEKTDPKGGPGLPTQTFVVSPGEGEGIDLTIIGLSWEK